MKKVLALFLALNMAVGLLLVPAAAYNEEESGCRDLEWHWETDDDGNEYIKIDQSIALGKDNYYIVDHIQGHQGAFRLYQLFYLGDALPEDAELYYVPDDADDTGISVDFGYDEEFAAYAMITFNEWDSSGSISIGTKAERSTCFHR